MKAEQLYEAIGDLEDAYIHEAKKARKSPWIKWGILAACCALILTAGGLLYPRHTRGSEEESTAATELWFSEAYFYQIDQGAYASYMGGKVIEEEKLGEKIEDVTLTAGWRNREGQWLTEEHLRGELYLIKGVSQELAVAVKFLDLGDALTTTHYYVILNQEADLSPVQDYYLAPMFPTDESAEEAEQTQDTTPALE